MKGDLCYIESVDGGIFPRTLGRLSWSGKAGLILSVSLPSILLVFNKIRRSKKKDNIDCTKWPWAQCPQAYRAQFGSNNDVNVSRHFPVLNDLKVGKAPEVPFVANDVTYKWGYYLTDGIYPEWAVLMKSISQPG
ncbi:ALP1-like protein isoform X1 [Tanacetum coccineum]